MPPASKARYQLVLTDLLLRRKLTILEGVTEADKARVSKYLVGSNWEWVLEDALDN